MYLTEPDAGLHRSHKALLIFLFVLYWGMQKADIVEQPKSQFR